MCGKGACVFFLQRCRKESHIFVYLMRVFMPVSFRCNTNTKLRTATICRQLPQASIYICIEQTNPLVGHQQAITTAPGISGIFLAQKKIALTPRLVLFLTRNPIRATRNLFLTKTFIHSAKSGGRLTNTSSATQENFLSKL